MNTATVTPGVADDIRREKVGPAVVHEAAIILTAVLAGAERSCGEQAQPDA